MCSYNDNYHRSIGMSPSEVTSTNQETVWRRLYGHESIGTPKFRVVDRVRISKAKRHFKKGFMANWTEGLFAIVDAHRSDPPVSRWADWHGDKWDGRNRNSRMLLYRKARRIELSPSYGGVTIEGKFW